jgi:hypothetical protein
VDVEAVALVTEVTFAAINGALYKLAAVSPSLSHTVLLVSHVLQPTTEQASHLSLKLFLYPSSHLEQKLLLAFWQVLQLVIEHSLSQGLVVATKAVGLVAGGLAGAVVNVNPFWHCKH